MKTPFSFLTLILFLIPNLNFGQAPSLGVTSSFAVFTAVGAFSNTGATMATGDIGTDVGLFSGFPPGVVMGSIHVADPIADQAAIDVASAYMFLDGLNCGTVLGVTLGSGQMLTPDIYCIGAAATLNGTLVLDGQGDPTSIFIFQIDGALATGTLANVVMINGASLCNVYWQVNGAFTLGDGSVFRGNLLVNGAIHLLEASSLFGRALSQGGAIDLHNNVIGIGLPPIAAVITANGPTTFCAGGSVTLSGNIDGVWSNGSITSSILLTTGGDYFVVNTTLCGSDTSNHIIVTVIPDLPPFISCPADVVIQCNASTLPANTGAATASDNCGPAPTVTFSDITAQGACLQSYFISRTWTATDASGNITSCTQSITVVDNTAPTITCPSNVVIQCSASTLPANTGTATAVDNCAAASTISSTDVVTPSGLCAQTYTITRTWHAADNCGNISTCTQTINVIDNISPSISCPNNVTLACGGNTLPGNTGVATGVDNCDATLNATFTDVFIPAAGCPSIVRTWTLTDDCGNSSTCTQSIVVTNSTTISITCPGAVAVQCAGQVPPANVNTVITSGTCGGIITVTFAGDVVSNQTCANRYNIIRTYTAVDVCGNVATCTQAITVFDNTPPSISCPGNITVQCASQVPVANPAAIVTADNCGGLATVTFIGDVISNQSCANRYNVTRTYRSTDACGNFFDCNQTITVFDNTPPSITCPSNITVQCASQVPVANPAGIVTADNCGGLATVTFIGDVITNQSCANRYNVIRTYRSTDACGNFFDCNQTITVFDNTPPSITCPGNITVQCASQVPVANPAAIVTADNCGGIATVTFIGDVISNFICTNRFVVTRTYVSTDACGNSAACNQIITVFDNSALSIICPADITVQCAAQVPAVNLNLGVTSAACGGTTTVVLLSEIISNQTCASRFILTRTYLATDACAQSATCVQVITVFDNTIPTITLPPGLVNGGTLDVQCYGQDPNWDLPVFTAASVTANDNCTGTVNVVFNQVLVDEGTCATDGYINLFRLTWTATDACGNSSSAFVFLALIDTIPPVIHDVPADITVNCDAMPEISSLVFATDECLCACVILTHQSEFTAGCQNGQVIVRTWTAKDRCGNVTTATQRITMIDNQPPTLHLLQPEMTGLNDGSMLEYRCSEGGIPDYYNTINAASMVGTSACGDAVSMTFSRKVTQAANCDFSGYIEQMILHWEAVDLCGHQAAMTITVSLIDNEAPVLIGVPSLACINDPSLKNIEATDNCGEAHVRFWDTRIPNPCGTGTAMRRTYEAYDNCGNMMRDTAILIPNDQTLPNLEFVNPMLDSLGQGEVIVLNCTAHNQQLTPFGINDVISENLCNEMVNINFTETLLETGDCSAGGNVALMQLLWTATDVCGNLSTLTAVASIEDKTSPVFESFRPVISIGCNDSLPGYVAHDNCGSVIITTSDKYVYNDHCASKYSIDRQVTATDPCGNATVGFQTIHVGSGGPVIEGVQLQICDDLTIPPVTAFDACADVFVDVTMIQDTLEEQCRGMVIQRTWSAIDACGDTTTIIQLIVMGDTTPPVILVPTYSVLYPFIDAGHNIVYLSQIDLMKKLAALDANTIYVSDDCGMPIIPDFTLVVTHDDCLITGFTERRIYTWIATDACGNSSSIIITIDVVDDVPPVILGVPNDTMIVCEPLPVIPFVHAEDATASVIYSESNAPGDGSGIFFVTRTWTATDACGNTSVTIQHITWIPNSFLVCTINVPEVVECNSHGVIITSDITGGFGPYTYEWQIVGYKCFIQSGQGTPDITIYMGWADVKIILTVTDAFGCQSMCMYILHCLEPGEIPITSIPVSINPDVNPNAVLVTPASVTSESESEYLKDLNLWPNPAKGTINLSFESSLEEEVVYSFVNFLGQIILSDRIVVQKGLNTRTIDIDRLPGGSYLMEVKSDKEMLTKVIVIMP